METNPKDYFKTERDYYVFVLLYTVDTVRDELLDLANIANYDNWHKAVKQNLFPIKTAEELKALEVLDEIHQELANKAIVSNNELAELSKLTIEEKVKPSRLQNDDVFVILEAGIDFKKDNMYLEQTAFVAFPRNSSFLKKIRHYCLDFHNRLFYCLNCSEDYRPIRFEDIKAETGYKPVASTDKVTVGVKYLRENNLIKSI